MFDSIGLGFPYTHFEEDFVRYHVWDVEENPAVPRDIDFASACEESIAIDGHLEVSRDDADYLSVLMFHPTLVMNYDHSLEDISF